MKAEGSLQRALPEAGGIHSPLLKGVWVVHHLLHGQDPLLHTSPEGSPSGFWCAVGELGRGRLVGVTTARTAAFTTDVHLLSRGCLF